MNTLIIVGLFLVALFALVGLFVLIRSDPHSKLPAEEPGINEKNGSATPTHSIEEEPLQMAQGLPSPKETSLTALGENTSFPISNGQFHELSVELHTLHQQAQELERRLSIITLMIDHIELSQNGNASIEHEAREMNETAHN